MINYILHFAMRNIGIETWIKVSRAITHPEAGSMRLPIFDFWSRQGPQP
jgi:hypothetical protein